MAAKFEILKNRKSQFIFNLLAPNGKIILISETYNTKTEIERMIKSVKKYAAFDKCYKRDTSGDCEFYFLVKGANGHIISKSKIYSSIAGMEKGIASVKANAPGAEIKDWTI